MVIIAREFLVSGLRIVAATQDTVIAASVWGKLKTLVQVVAIAALILDDPPHIATSVLVACAVAITIWSGIDYFIDARDLLRAPA
jgi:CDP-diacylglycerol--glycerol-3-phosphate 3-phosphatidyltransferase